MAYQRRFAGIGLPRLMCVAVTALACGGGSDASAPETVVVPASISFSTATAIVGVRAQVRLDHTVRDAQNRDITSSATIHWTSSNPSIATVNDTGLVAGVTLGGPVTITADAGGHTASIALTVTPARIEIAPAVSIMAVTTTVQLSGSAVDYYGAPLDAGPVTWTSSDPGVATIDQTGFVRALAVGSAEIHATAGGRTTLFGIVVGAPSIYDGTFYSTGATAMHIVVQFGIVVHIDASLHPTATCSLSLSGDVNVPIGPTGGFRADIPPEATSVNATFGSANSVQGSVLGTFPTSCQYGQLVPTRGTLGTFTAYR